MNKNKKIEWVNSPDYSEKYFIYLYKRKREQKIKELLK
jgi:hypothetical protein